MVTSARFPRRTRGGVVKTVFVVLLWLGVAAAAAIALHLAFTEGGYRVVLEATR